jgi:urease accessory protein
MRHALLHRPAGGWPDLEAKDVVTLDFHARYRRRTRLTTDQGSDLHLNLPKAVPMADGDGLLLEDGSWLKIRAAAEPLIEVRHSDHGKLARIAWHLGNRHLPTEIQSGVLRIKPDSVIEEMLVGLGADIKRIDAPFQPEGGAYGGHRHEHASQGGSND